MDRKCAHIECVEDAEFEITDLADARPDMNGTNACAAHLSALIGHAEPWNGRNAGWRIDTINPF